MKSVRARKKEEPMEAGEKRYLELLSRSFPTIAEASAEVINLSAILNLPKSTEFFASDIHGATAQARFA